MRWDNLYVAAFGAYVPDKIETADEAIAQGRYTEGEKVANGIRAVHVADPQTEAPGVMAAAAGRQAVERSGIPHEQFDLVVHAGIGHQGQEFWQPASYVHNNTVGGPAAAIEIKQGSNGGLAAFELGASWVVARPGTAALVTAGDSFHLPYFDRWNSDDQQVYGDGAGSAVLSSQGGFARVISTASVADSTLEPIYRGPDAWTLAPFAQGSKVDLRGRKRAYLATGEDLYDQTIERMSKSLFAVVGEVFEGTGSDISSVDWLIHANTGKSIVEWAFYRPLGLDASRTVYDWGCDYGHMGAADHLVNLEYVVRSGKAKAGDKVLTIGVGTGFMWTAILIELLETPSW
ncbi:ketoacyl-ACP synthase III family protein [Actinocrinis sp.]|uniref:ketoacyl-ACP synthase III family protein n=1 Tax=Actinocrinis sp. TaxID=1920516 RepID=UPI002D3532D0|nr:ketoacyl-ACP synthase III family protein [Actinocrinis sp.]HZP54794.1 ketoacyl-ACP synthase III family protein [Actinocrinis sp.]HZU55378.1 ketoacyl-ACP synthase III family protein [Actinocrinis sp.]